MTSMVTFGSVTVPSYHLDSEKVEGGYYYEVSFKCRTGNLSDITALQALQGPITVARLESGYTRITTIGGTAETLTINGTAHANCYIAEITPVEVPFTFLSRYEFTIRFIQQTYIPPSS